MTLALVVVAAGSGARLGLDVPKAFVELAGHPLLLHAAGRLAPAVDRAVAVVPPDMIRRAEDLLRSVRDRQGRPVVVAAGGTSRSASVRAGLEAVAVSGDDVVAVHDAARPLVEVATLHAAVAAVVSGADAAAPGLAVADTLKRVASDDPARVVATVDRSCLRAVQTPQVFRASWLHRAHAGAPAATDDLALVEQAGGTVVLVPGALRNTKVTFAEDLAVLEALAG